MSDRNSYDYFNFDTFDEGIDSRDYRRRQPDRRNSSTYNMRPSYNRRPQNNRRRRRRRNRRRLRNRILIVTSGILILALLITLIAVMAHGCGKRTTPAPVSTETKPPATTAAATVAPTQQAVSAADKLSLTTFVPAQPNDDNTMGAESGAIYVWNNAGFELFGGSESSGQSYAETINALAGKLTGVKVYSMIVPNHTEMGLPARLKSQVNTNSQADCMRAAYAAMDKNVVTPVNPYNYLSEHCNEYIYFNSDHHWTGLGAYYAYTAFAATTGVPALSLAECTEQTIPGFTGSLTELAAGLETDIVHYWQFPYQVKMDITAEGGITQTYDSPYYDAESSGSLSYGVFIYGDNPLTVMRSSSPNAQEGKKIAVIKESYGNAFVPYLTNNYEEVHVMDMRTFRNTSNTDFVTYCQNNGITDVLFLNGVMSASNPTLLESTEAMFN